MATLSKLGKATRASLTAERHEHMRRLSNSFPFGRSVDEKQLKLTEVREQPMKSERDGINPAAKPSGTGCAECLALGGWWFHLRRCAECGHIGCCDSSPSQHASKHHAATGTRQSRASSRASGGFTTIAQGSSSPARSFTLLIRIRSINRCQDRPKRCPQTGKRCFTNRVLLRDGRSALRTHSADMQFAQTSWILVRMNPRMGQILRCSVNRMSFHAGLP
jgi:Zn-finger in ubiquitin-hydrolases and other protein